MVLSAPRSVSSKTVSRLLDEIASELSQEQHLFRIKKLLLYACTGTWENNRQQLDSIPLKALLQDLFEICPTYEQLQHQLNQVVATLNKSAEYTIIAQTVISRFHAVYAELRQGQPSAASPMFYQVLAQRLEQQPEHIRIKKLLLLTCRSTWENNLTKLAQLKVLDLVQELHQIAPTAEQLKATLTQVARALSKPEEYMAVAKTVTTLFQTVDLEETEVASHGLTQLRYSPSTQFPSSPAKSIGHRALSPVSKAPERVTPKVLTLAQPCETSDLFNLRLELMQDANPLKVKILLFSLLHEPFQKPVEQDGLLKTHELDDLLRMLFLCYPLYSEVASHLKEMAEQLAAEEYIQTAEAVLKAIYPFYTDKPESSLRSASAMQAKPAEMTRIKACTNEITLPNHD